MAKKALITGITGQDGSYLSELLLDKGYEVHGWSSEECDVTRPDTLRVAIQQAQPDEIYHLAAQSHVGDSRSVLAVSSRSLRHRSNEPSVRQSVCVRAVPRGKLEQRRGVATSLYRVHAGSVRRC